MKLEHIIGTATLAVALTGCAPLRCTGEGTVQEKSWYYDWNTEMIRSEYVVRTPCGQATYRPGFFERNPAIGQRVEGVVYGEYFEKR